jgi:hypothetical protein
MTSLLAHAWGPVSHLDRPPTERYRKHNVCRTTLQCRVIIVRHEPDLQLLYCRG